MLKLRLHQSFFFKLVLLTAISQILLGILAGFVFFRKAYTKSLESNKRSMEVRLDLIETFSNSKFQSLGQNLTLLGASSAFSNLDPIEISSSLKSYRVSSLFLAGEDVSVYDSDKKKIANNSMVQSNSYDFADTLDVFNEIRPSHLYMGENKWTNGIPHRLLAVSVSNTKNADGVLTLDFNYRRLFNFWAEQRFGQKGFVAVIDKKGRFIFYPEMSKVREGLYLSDLNPSWKSPLDVPEYSNNLTSKINQKNYAISYRWSNESQLGFVLFSPRSEVLAGAFDLLTSLYLMLGIALVVSLMGTLILAKRLSQPITQLAQNMVSFSEGNLEARTNLKSTDEIGMLGKGFDQMAESLKTTVEELASHRAHLEEEVKQRTQELERTNIELEKLSRTDPLTCLSNRRDLVEKIEYEVHRNARSNLDFAFILLDVDHFKNFNDTYGHECGDEVLVALSQNLTKIKRKPDIVGRWGGEEFLLVLPETNLDQANLVAERIRMHIANLVIDWKKEKLSVTITLGVSVFDKELGIDGSIDLADRRLYLGKSSGRNKVVFAGN